MTDNLHISIGLKHCYQSGVQSANSFMAAM